MDRNRQGRPGNPYDLNDVSRITRRPEKFRVGNPYDLSDGLKGMAIVKWFEDRRRRRSQDE